MHVKLNREVSVTLKFVIGGILWILLSDNLLNYVGSVFVVSVSHFQSLKGLLFIGISGGYLFLVLHDAVSATRSTQAELEVMFDLNPVPCALVNGESLKFARVNDSAMTLFGLSRKEFSTAILSGMIVSKDEGRIEEMKLFLKTGRARLGIWEFHHKSGQTVTAELLARKIESRDLYLISFVDLTDHMRVQHELRQTNRDYLHELSRRADYLEREHEELAYRASQTEHVNAELITVNEQLLMINKRIVAENERVGRIFSTLREVVCSYDLSEGGLHYQSSGAQAMFECDQNVLCTPWFWLDLVHPEDETLKEMHHRMIFEKGETFSVFRIVTPQKSIRKLLIHARIEKQAEGNTFLVVAFSDISGFSEEHIQRYLYIRTA